MLAGLMMEAINSARGHNREVATLEGEIEGSFSGETLYDPPNQILWRWNMVGLLQSVSGGSSVKSRAKGSEQHKKLRFESSCLI
jgi:hypothetical protein